MKRGNLRGRLAKLEKTTPKAPPGGRVADLADFFANVDRHRAGRPIEDDGRNVLMDDFAGTMRRVDEQMAGLPTPTEE